MQAQPALLSATARRRQDQRDSVGWPRKDCLPATRDQYAVKTERLSNAESGIWQQDERVSHTCYVFLVAARRSTGRTGIDKYTVQRPAVIVLQTLRGWLSLSSPENCHERRHKRAQRHLPASCWLNDWCPLAEGLAGQGCSRTVQARHCRNPDVATDEQSFSSSGKRATE